MFATASGNVRRNRLSDFRNVRSAGLIAMKLDEGDRLIGVATCREGEDAFLATRKGRCIRFELSDDTVRVFAGRDSSGVRGIRLADGDEVISLSVLQHVEASNEEREAYLKQANAKRRSNGDEEADAIGETPTNRCRHATGRGTHRRSWRRPRNSCSPSRMPASASERPPTNTA